MRLGDNEARELAENMIDSMREALVVLDDALNVVSANRSFYRRFRVEPSETEGQKIFELGNGQWSIPALRRLLEQIIPDKQSIEGFEVRHDFERIGKKIMLLNARQIRRGPDRRPLILLVIDDVTERVEAQEKELRDSEEKYRKLTEEANSIVIGLGRDRRIMFFNTFSEKLFGYDREEIIGNPFLDTIVPRTDSSGNDNSRIIEEVFEAPEKYIAHESEGVRKDGSRLWFAWSPRAIPDESGATAEIIIDGSDITHLVRARQQFVQKSATLDALMEFIPEGVIITDANLVVQQASRRMGELTGLPVSRLLHTDEHERLEMLELYRPDGTRITRPEELPLSKTVNDGRYYKDYVAELKTDGASRILSANSAPIRDAEGAIIGAIGVWRDVTQTRRYEEALRSRTEELAAVNREMETFSYSVSHDLRGPLHTIKGFADFLVEDYREQLGDEGAECLRHIESGVDKMTGLIDDMLRLSRVGRSEMRREEVDLSEMVSSFSYELQQSNPERTVEWVVQPALRANADPRLMGLAIQNLLRNAWKFTARRHPARIEFGAVSRADRPTYYIADNGVGFDMQFAKSIFEPFRRLHAEKEYNGSGIGLSIVRRAIERHGGDTWAEGEPGRGARFFFTLS